MKWSDFFADIQRLSDDVFHTNAQIIDHRDRYPWLTGCLGNPFAPVWFVAENPSLSQVAKAIGDSPEVQWSVSAGDKLFRGMLVKHGFKRGGATARKGWRCYITDVVKSAATAKAWRDLPRSERLLVAEAWAPVLAYELEVGKPRVIVALGGEADALLRHLVRKRLIPPIPEQRRIHHYSYLASRAEGQRGPGHPERIAEWDAEFAEIARLAAKAR